MMIKWTLVLGSVLLLSGCYYNAHTGLSEPGYSGYYYHGYYPYRPYNPYYSGQYYSRPGYYEAPSQSLSPPQDYGSAPYQPSQEGYGSAPYQPLRPHQEELPPPQGPYPTVLTPPQ
jgi:hypothetical protein